MSQSADPHDSGLLQDRPPAQQWGILILGSLVFGALLEAIGLPAALLMGPMIAGMAVSTNGGTIRAPRLPVQVAQAVVGCLVARAITGDIVRTFLADWPLFLAVVVTIVATSSALGWTMARHAVVPGTTAVWGTAPGAASVMLVMAGAFGADARLVAFMQYFRVVCVAGLASLVARVWIGPTLAAAPHIVWFPALPMWDFAATVAVVGLGVAVGFWRIIPGGTLLVPMIGGALMQATGLAHLALPPWLLALSYALLGWSVGLGFTRAILMHARRALPPVLIATAVIIGVAGGLAFLLVVIAGVDPLTAYLATTPGGMDTVAIIAASSTVDVPFVMALQTVRFVIVLFAGPPLARLIAQRVDKKSTPVSAPS
ncbi:MAG TPA: AbrB family transcriptional regulator [Hyphomicrobiaceae bacterium]|nr:AbrB family transcriptional regulator [Hyphomicrobiaceae bacterium]